MVIIVTVGIEILFILSLPILGGPHSHYDGCKTRRDISGSNPCGC